MLSPYSIVVHATIAFIHNAHPDLFFQIMFKEGSGVSCALEIQANPNDIVVGNALKWKINKKALAVLMSDDHDGHEMCIET